MLNGSEISFFFFFVHTSTPSLGRSLTSLRWETEGIPSVITVGVYRHPVQIVGLHVSGRRLIVDFRILHDTCARYLSLNSRSARW